MADQDWKTGGLNRNKYVIRKPCRNCGGSGVIRLGCHQESFVGDCEDCRGLGHIPVANPTAQYFVLRIDCDPETGEPYDPNARKALAAYSMSVRAENPEFADDIRRWLEETREHADG